MHHICRHGGFALDIERMGSDQRLCGVDRHSASALARRFSHCPHAITRERSRSCAVGMVGYRSQVLRSGRVTSPSQIARAASEVISPDQCKLTNRGRLVIGRVALSRARYKHRATRVSSGTCSRITIASGSSQGSTMPSSTGGRSVSDSVTMTLEKNALCPSNPHARGTRHTGTATRTERVDRDHPPWRNHRVSGTPHGRTLRMARRGGSGRTLPAIAPVPPVRVRTR